MGPATTPMYASRGLAGGKVSMKITTPKSKVPAEWAAGGSISASCLWPVRGSSVRV